MTRRSGQWQPTRLVATTTSSRKYSALAERNDCTMPTSSSLPDGVVGGGTVNAGAPPTHTGEGSSGISSTHDHAPSATPVSLAMVSTRDTSPSAHVPPGNSDRPMRGPEVRTDGPSLPPSDSASSDSSSSPTEIGLTQRRAYSVPGAESRLTR